jgi:hypothetical protein
MARPKFSFLDRLNIDQDVTQRLSQSIQRVIDGNSEVFRSPHFKDEDPETVLAKWDKVFQAQSTKLERELEELELSNRSKFGPRSIAKPWSERKDSVMSYFGKDTAKTGPDITSRVPKGSGSLRVKSLESASKALKNSTSSGLPYLKKKSLVKERLLKSFQSHLERRDPCVLFTRTQELGKTRPVWGYPIADTLMEMRLFLTLLEFQKKQDWRAAIVGPDTVDQKVTDLFLESDRSGGILLSVDFSSYDTTVRKTVQTSVREYVRKLFQSGEAHDIIDYVFERFGTIGIITPDGVMEGEHGVPSGSTLTNEVDSLAQW